MSVKRSVIALILVAWFGSSAAATPIVDQSFAPSTPTFVPFSTGFFNVLGQSFTIGLEGTLEAVDLLVGASAPHVRGPLLVQLQRLDPYPGPAFSMTIPGLLIPGIGPPSWLHVAFQPVAVSPGESWGVGLQYQPGDLYGWYADTAGGYDGGQALKGSVGGPIPIDGYDFGFRTYVTPAEVPEPATMTLLSMAFAAAAVRRRRFGWRRPGH